MNRTFYFFGALLVILTWLCREHIFFGDMVQFGSRHPHFFYETNFSSFWLPNQLDSGHPPVFGIYIALMWKLFGKSLAVSHFAMLPFLLIIAYEIPRLVSLLTKGSHVFLFSLLILLEPTLLAQATLVSPDIFLVAFFLVVLNAFFRGRYILMSAALIPMSFISLRGMMVLFGLYIAFYGILLIRTRKLFDKERFIVSCAFIPSVALCLGWLLIHYTKTGWIGFHNDSPWASSFQQVGLKQMLGNLFLMIWRMADYGRIFVWIAVVLSGIYLFRKRNFPADKLVDLIILFVVLFIVFAANTLFADGLVGHRYYLPLYLLLLMILVVMLNEFPERLKKISLLVMSVLLLSGHLLIYPPKIAMGWDATLAHIPYYQLRKNVIDYMHTNEIPLERTGSGFPNLDSREYLELNGDTSRFMSYHLDNDYILWSNVFNYPDELIDELDKKQPVYAEQSRGVFMRLYKIK